MKPSSYNTNEIGKKGERIAARHLRRNGYRILSRNCHCGKNELDLVAQNKNYIIFVEVKTRSFETADVNAAEEQRPANAVHAQKRKRTIEAALKYLYGHPNKRTPRLDVIEVYLDRSRRFKPFFINHIEGAFDARGRIH